MTFAAMRSSILAHPEWPIAWCLGRIVGLLVLAGCTASLGPYSVELLTDARVTLTTNGGNDAPTRKPDIDPAD